MIHINFALGIVVAYEAYLRDWQILVGATVVVLVIDLWIQFEKEKLCRSGGGCRIKKEIPRNLQITGYVLSAYLWVCFLALAWLKYY